MKDKRGEDREKSEDKKREEEERRRREKKKETMNRDNEQRQTIFS